MPPKVPRYKDNAHDIDCPIVPNEKEKFNVIKTLESTTEPIEIEVDSTNDIIYKRWGQHNVKADPKREVIVKISCSATVDGVIIKREVAFDRWANRKTAVYY